MKNTQADINPWEAIATYGAYTLWANPPKGIYVLRSEAQGQPTPWSGGYFTIAAALKVKGIRQ